MKMFEDKRTWIDHEMENHWRSWSCCVCEFTSDQQSDVKSHLERSHPEILSEEGGHAMIYITSRPLDYIDASRCILCDWCQVLTSKGSATMVSRASFMGHLAHHLEQMALFALPREEPGGHSGSINSSHAANCGSQASQIAVNSSLAGNESLIELATRAGTKKPSSPTHQILESQAAAFITSSQAFSSQSQDRDAIFAWMARGEPHDHEDMLNRAETSEHSGHNEIAHSEIVQVDTELFAILTKAAALCDVWDASHEGFKFAMHAIFARLKMCSVGTPYNDSVAISRALDDYAAILLELESLVIYLEATSAGPKRWVLVAAWREHVGKLQEKASDAHNRLGTALKLRAATKGQSNTRTMARTRKYVACEHFFKVLKSDTHLIVWNCDMCHSGPHWWIHECTNCQQKACQSCRAKT